MDWNKIQAQASVAASIFSCLSLIFIYSQTTYVGEQTEALNRSVNSQIISDKTNLEKELFEKKKFFADQFYVNFTVKNSEITYNKEKENFEFNIDIQNIGKNNIVLSDKPMIDIVRCINKSRYSDDKTWISEKEFEKRKSSTQKETFDLVESDSGSFSLVPGAQEQNRGWFNFPQKNFQDFLPNETIALEYVIVVFDPTQYLFKKELQDLNFKYGPVVRLKGMEMTFPMVHRTIRETRTFKLENNQWQPTENNKDCVEILVSD